MCKAVNTSSGEAVYCWLLPWWTSESLPVSPPLPSPQGLLPVPRTPFPAALWAPFWDGSICGLQGFLLKPVLLNKAGEMGRKAEFCSFCLFFFFSKEGLFVLLAKSTEALLTDSPEWGFLGCCLCWNARSCGHCEVSEAVGGAISFSSSKTKSKIIFCVCLKF